jgi:flagellar protein FliS
LFAAIISRTKMNQNPSNFRPSAAATGSQQYLDASIRMASPAKLRLMLIERAVEVSGILAAQWREGQRLGPNEHSLKLMELISELLSGVAGGSNDQENKLCLQVADLYVFLLQHLVAAETNSDAQSIDEIGLVLQAEAETWRSAVAQEAAGKPTHAPTGPQSTPQASTGGLNFSA